MLSRSVCFSLFDLHYACVHNANSKGSALVVAGTAACSGFSATADVFNWVLRCVAGLENYAGLVQHAVTFGSSDVNAQQLISVYDANGLSLLLSQAVKIMASVRN